MKKELGVNPYLFPMPVLMIATYSDGDVVNVMNMAWGGICADNMVSLNIEEDRKTSENIKKHGAFTLSIADIPHIEAADFFGIATGNKMPDKLKRSGLTAVKSEKVDAPIVQEFPHWSAKSLKTRWKYMVIMSSVKLSGCWQTSLCWTKQARSMPQS